MPKANIKLIFLITLSLAYLGMTGCSSPEEKKIKQMREAAQLNAEGATPAALAILEALAESFPNDPAILQAIGQIYSEQDDPMMAAFFLQQAYKQSPNDVELLFQTYLAAKKAGQATGELIETLANDAPTSMQPAMWIELGQYLKAQGKSQIALEALLKGVGNNDTTAAANTAASIGQLYLAQNELAPAERWLTIADQADDSNDLSTLSQLLKIKLRNEDWDGADQLLARIDLQLPGELNSNEWPEARKQLSEWRLAQSAIQAEKAQIQTLAETASKNETASSKASIIDDLNAAKALANKPAIEIDSATINDESSTAFFNPTGLELQTAQINFNPEIVIQAATPDTTIELSYNEENMPRRVDTSAPANATLANSLSQPIQALDQLLAQATLATQTQNYSLAISSYWQAISIANQRADIWNSLSENYLADGQLKNAETTALEAIRLAPADVNYTLDYLRIVQDYKQSNDFLSELETAYDRFPRSPEITLSLARAYERINRNNISASSLYSRFIEIAPAHPLRNEADRALERLR